MDQHDDRTPATADDEQATAAVQEQLPLDEPVPFRLTTAGRRLVAPDAEPALRVVPGHAGDVVPGHAGDVVPGHAGDVVPGRGRAVEGDATALDQLDGATRARARAMRRGGMHTLDIAEQLDADPLHVEQWVADLPVPLGARRRRLASVPAAGRHDPEVASGAARAAVVAAWQAARDAGRTEAEQRLATTPSLRSGLGIVAALLEQDHHALLLAGDDVDLAAAAWRWLVTTLDLGDATTVRVLVRHDPGRAGDRVARTVAATLSVPLAAVTTTRDPARTGREPAVRLRVADPTLAGRVAGWRRALLVEVTSPTPDADVGA